MNRAGVKYKYSDFAILLTIIVSAVLSIVFKWLHDGAALNFMGGDAKDYYSALVSVFISGDFTDQQAQEWYLLRTAAGTVNVHPVGVSVLLLPFFLFAYISAVLFSFPVDGYSLPFQVSVACAAMFYATLGLIYLKKLFQRTGIRDSVSAAVILLIFFGTNLLHYTISEAGMSHVYSFGLISAFLYFSNIFVALRRNKDLIICGVLLGLILLVRPNNIFVLPLVLIWFGTFAEFRDFFKGLIRNPAFYISALVSAAILSLQGLTWYLQSGSFVLNTYKRDGFYWSDPQFLKMLFGFDGGFFIYTPLCFLLILGLISLYKRSRFAFAAATLFLVILFYFFSSYWAYTYFDGLGIRVLVDYYGLFAFLGALLLEELFELKKALAFVSVLMVSALSLNLIYIYQANRGIILRAGMNFEKFRYVFLHTSHEYQNCLGGSNELVPYADVHPAPLFEGSVELQSPFDFSGLEFGPSVVVERLGVQSNRLRVAVRCIWREVVANSSYNTQLCMNVEDPETKESRSYTQFRLNETPATQCCAANEKNYTANLVGDFREGDRLSVYLWNISGGEFSLGELAVKVYNYSYQLN